MTQKIAGFDEQHSLPHKDGYYERSQVLKNVKPISAHSLHYRHREWIIDAERGKTKSEAQMSDKLLVRNTDVKSRRPSDVMGVWDVILNLVVLIEHFQSFEANGFVVTEDTHLILGLFFSRPQETVNGNCAVLHETVAVNLSAQFQR